MAKRPVFIAKEVFPYFETVDIEFTFHSGFATSQKQKSIKELHTSFNSVNPEKVLEISTKGENTLGVALSAFNLSMELDGEERCIESVFQGSKCFELGGPYHDLYDVKPWEAKKDPRIRNSGKIIGFALNDEHFENEPKDYFYNWIYMQALCQHDDYCEKLKEYGAFTDIEFNPKKSINCQARAIAIAVGLMRANMFDKCMGDKIVFLDTVYRSNQ